MTQPPPPDDVPRSPSGRVPKWVMDEAAGRQVEAVPFRAPTTSILGGPPATAPRRSGRGRRRSSMLLTWIVVAAILVGAATLTWWQRQPSLTAAGGPTPGQEASTRLLAAPAPVAGKAASSHAFLHEREDGSPLTWSPCRPIRYVVRPDHSPAGGGALLTSAFATVSRATGLAFEPEGGTDEAPTFDREPYQPDRYGDRWAPVLVAWVTPQEVPDFHADIAGKAGPAWVSTSEGDQAYVSGVVMLDPASVVAARAAGGQAAAKAIVLHELGHLMGLAHVGDRSQLMFPQSGRVTAYGKGDLAGLAALGNGPCQPDL